MIVKTTSKVVYKKKILLGKALSVMQDFLFISTPGLKVFLVDNKGFLQEQKYHFTKTIISDASNSLTFNPGVETPGL